MGAARPLPEHCPGLVPSVYVVLPTRTLCAPLFMFHGCFHSVLPALLVRNINQRRVFPRAQKQTVTKDGLGVNLGHSPIGLRFGLPLDRRQHLPKVYRSTDRDEITP
jgi:hypothetical protein